MNGTVGNTQVEDFLNPKSMPTPAAAGAIVALIAGALFKNFGISVAICTAILSFMVGLIVFNSKEFKSQKTSKITKAVLYMINSLIIFAMATGTTSVMAEGLITQERPYFYDWTKSKKNVDPPIKPNTGPYDISVKVQREDAGRIQKLLQDAGFVEKKYRAIVKVKPKPGVSLADVETVTLKLPESEFKQPNITLSGDQLEQGLEIKAWQSFPIEAEIKTKSQSIFPAYQDVELK